ncbi:lon protease 1, mitochondrial [Artemisia annua]|uniref:Lon protease 1, mitochondrial n=1 Tax=Artemisia annua TaxID=35608 RepID=A0A2U1NB83_ARTAN|nr:lon protease 1, mitochondrial [Artemisia annua]
MGQIDNYFYGLFGLHIENPYKQSQTQIALIIVYLMQITALLGASLTNCSDENFDVLRAQQILDEDHYGLSDVKERIPESIAVGKLRGTSHGTIIFLSCPHGVGKTSIGCSIARALNRKSYTFFVGGLSNVAEINGVECLGGRPIRKTRDIYQNAYMSIVRPHNATLECFDSLSPYIGALS